jgi:hypothetical protein
MSALRGRTTHTHPSRIPGESRDPWFSRCAVEKWAPASAGDADLCSGTVDRQIWPSLNQLLAGFTMILPTIIG